MNQVFKSGLLAILSSFILPIGAIGAVVSSLNDSGTGSLRAALLSGGGNITFAVDGTIVLNSSLNISSSSTIDGTGHAITISGNNAVRIISVNTPITLSLMNLAISNGAVVGANGGSGAAGGSVQGGGILMAGSTLIASNCQFVANTVTAGNGGANSNPNSTGGSGGTASGGAIELVNGTLRATNCQFYGNAANGGAGATGQPTFGAAGNALGGAIDCSTSSVVLVDCLFQTNQVHGGLAANGLVGTNGPYVLNSGAALGGAVSAQGGSLTNLNCQFVGNAGLIPPLPVQNFKDALGVDGPAQGGAIFDNGGSLVTDGSTFTSNSVVGGEAQNVFVMGGSGQGGAIFSKGLTLLTACLFSQNSALGGSNGSTAGDGQGGAVYVNGSATISQSWFTSNLVQGGIGYVSTQTNGASGMGKGGAVFNTNSLTIIGCTFSDNQALGISAVNAGGSNTTSTTSGQGGAIFNLASCILTNTTLTGNLAVGGSTVYTNGSGITGADAFGGALYNSTGTVVSVNNTFALNDAEGGTGLTNGNSFGGGSLSTNGSVTLINTIFNNGIASSNYFGALVDGGHNLSSDGSCNFTNTGSLNNTDPLLGPLQDNGGPTPTMALLPGSPAIDAGDTAAAPQLDQRGIVRPVGPAADIGAFEYYDTNSPPACTYILSATNLTLTMAASTGTVSVVANYYCDWAAGSDSGWLTILSATNGAGSGLLTYSVTANNSQAIPRIGIVTIAGQTFTVTQNGTDTTLPTVTITAPAANSKSTNAVVTVTGTAKDNIGVAAVEWRLENANGVGAYQTATGTTNWSAGVSGLTPGGNTVRVRARDLNNNLSSEVTRTFLSVQVSPLTLTIDGSGTVSPDLNGQILQLGNSYTMTAKPGAGNVFSNWSGSVTSSAAKLTFVMVSNMVLQASFTTNLFPNVQGTYNGLALDKTNLMHTRSGYFSLKLAAQGTVSGQFIIGGLTHAVKSQAVSADGQTEIALFGGIPKQQVMTAELQFDLTNGTGQVNGTLSDARVVNGVQQPATWVSELSGDRAGFFTSTNPAPQAGPYTLVFPGGDGTNEPAGYGFATVKVDGSGNVQMTGLLADGTPVRQHVGISKDGRWPFFMKLSLGGNASILGWLNFTNQAGSDVSGQVVWTKLPLPLAVYYPAGFVESIAAEGSQYVAPTGTNGILDFSSGFIQFGSGTLVNPFANNITLGADGKVTNTSPNALSATINKTTGVFSGKVTVSGTSTVLPFKGAVLQSQHRGYGYFLNIRQSGPVLLSQ